MHGIILHEEYRDRMRKLSPENLGKLVENMFRIDAGEEPELFGDEYLDFFSETVCGRVGRDIELSDKKSRVGKLGGAPKGNQNATKNNQKQAENNQKTTKKQAKTTPNTNNQLPITNTNNIYPKKNNSFVNGCTKSDIDFENLELKVIKNQ